MEKGCGVGGCSQMPLLSLGLHPFPIWWSTVSLPWTSSLQQELASEAALEAKSWTDPCRQPWPGRIQASPGSSMGM